MTFISFIITRNSDNDCFSKCLSSLFLQSFTDFEVICVKDNLSKKDLTLIESFDKDKLHLISADDENIIEKCVDESCGRYLCFFSSDSFICDVNALENVHKYIIEDSNTVYVSDSQLSFSHEDFLNKFLYNYSRITFKKYESIPSDEYVGNLSLSNFFFKREVFDEQISLENTAYEHESLLLLDFLGNVNEINTIPLYFCKKEIKSENLVSAEKYIKLFKHYHAILSFSEDNDFNKLLERVSHNFLKIKELKIPEFKPEDYEVLEKEIQSINGLLDNNNQDYSFKIKRLMRYVKNIIHGKITDFDVAISVIIPAYNVEEYLGDCLNSLINQSFDDFEIIVVDDFSSDSTVDVINYYSRLDNRIRFIPNNKKGGSGGTRNYAMKFARGKYILFVDADDWLDLNTLEKLYDYAEKYETQNLMFKGIHYNDYSKRFYKDNYFSIPSLNQFIDRTFNVDEIYDEMFKIFVGPVNKLYLRSFLEDIDASFPENLIHEDNPFFYHMFCESERSYLVDEYFYNRRVWKGSITSLRDDTELGTVEIVEDILNVFIRNGLYEKYKELLLNRIIFKLRNRSRLVGDSFKEEYFKRAKIKLWKFMFEYGLFDDFVENLCCENREYFNRMLYSVDYKAFLES